MEERTKPNLQARRLKRVPRQHRRRDLQALLSRVAGEEAEEEPGGSGARCEGVEFRRDGCEVCRYHSGGFG